MWLSHLLGVVTRGTRAVRTRKTPGSKRPGISLRLEELETRLTPSGISSANNATFTVGAAGAHALAAPAPFITLSTTSLNLVATAGAPGTPQTYTVSGTHLIAPITITARPASSCPPMAGSVIIRR